MKIKLVGAGLALLVLAVTPWMTGCGDFWQAPTGTTTDTTTLTASETSIVSGASVTLTATISSTSATGTVTFYSGTTSLGTGTLSSGVATLTTTSLTNTTTADITYSLTAAYGGDSTYEASTSDALSITVTPLGTTANQTSLSISPSAPTTADDVTLTATVSAAAATGTVTFYDGTTSLGTGSLSVSSPNTATFTTASGLSAGSHTLKASYGGDGTYKASSGSLTITVTTPASSDCGYQDSTNGVYATADDSFLSGSTNAVGSTLISVSTADENAVCAQNTNTAVTATAPVIVSSSVGSNATDSSLYGTNAAVLAYGADATTASGATINVTGGSISTSGQYGSGVFASGDGAAVTLSGTTILTYAANARAAVAAEGGALTLTNMTSVTTYGAESPAIATDQGGGTVTVSNGTFTANDAEAVVVEGAGAVTLSGTSGASLTSTLGDDRGILLYQDTATTDASATSSFTMTNGSLSYTCDATATTACGSGDTTSGQSNPATVFAVANTTATISLTDVTVTNDTPTSSDSQGTLLTAAALNSGTWGASGSNGGSVTFTAKGETLTGDVIVDANSTAALTLNQDSAKVASKLTGAINNANSGSTTVSLTLDAASSWVVTGDSYLTKLTDANASYGNISCATGVSCTVYVNGKAITID
jgi:hypothetical protein